MSQKDQSKNDCITSQHSARKETLLDHYNSVIRKHQIYIYCHGMHGYKINCNNSAALGMFFISQD